LQGLPLLDLLGYPVGNPDGDLVGYLGGYPVGSLGACPPAHPVGHLLYDLTHCLAGYQVDCLLHYLIGNLLGLAEHRVKLNKFLKKWVRPGLTGRTHSNRLFFSQWSDYSNGSESNFGIEYGNIYLSDFGIDF